MTGKATVLLAFAAAAAAVAVVFFLSGSPAPLFSACSAGALGFRSWLVPPYIFAAVNFIVIAILKLSLRSENRRRPPAPIPAKSPPIAAASWSEFTPPPPEKSFPAMDLAEGRLDPTPEKKQGGGGEGNDTMDDTWRTIMEASKSPAIMTKSATTRERAPADLAPPAPARGFGKSETFSGRRNEEGWRRKDFVVAAAKIDEQDRRFEAFIRMTREQIRIQRQESDRRRYMEAAALQSAVY